MQENKWLLTLVTLWSVVDARSKGNHGNGFCSSLWSLPLTICFYWSYLKRSCTVWQVGWQAIINRELSCNCTNKLCLGLLALRQCREQSLSIQLNPLVLLNRVEIPKLDEFPTHTNSQTQLGFFFFFSFFLRRVPVSPGTLLGTVLVIWQCIWESECSRSLPGAS